jgi:hypothetical protein
MRVFTAADDLLHNDYSTFGPHARESLALTAPIPDAELLVFAYVWREGGNRWGRFLFVAGPDMAKPEFVDFSAEGTYTGEDLRDFDVDGLHWSQPEPLYGARVGYAGAELTLDLAFHGWNAPFSYHDNADGCPPFMAHERYEQSGRTEVTLDLRGRQVQFTGRGQRDHSWGPRNWAAMQHWKWMNCATVDGETAIHCMQMNAYGKQLTTGYLYAEGTLSPVVHADVNAELDATLCHRRVVGRYRDELGREMAMDAEFAAGWSMPIGHLVLNEVGMHARLDGASAIAHVELGWPEEYVRNNLTT